MKLTTWGSLQAVGTPEEENLGSNSPTTPTSLPRCRKRYEKPSEPLSVPAVGCKYWAVVLWSPEGTGGLARVWVSESVHFIFPAGLIHRER